MDPRPTSAAVPDETPSPAVVERAAEWLAHLESGDATDADRAALRAWRDAHPSHALALDRMSGMAGQLGERAQRETMRRLFLRPNKAPTALLGLATIALTGWFAVQHMTTADQSTAAGEIRTVALKTDDRITLATDSAADVDDARRTVRLLRGEVLARVAKGAPAPFVVQTRDGTAQALGTAFTVRRLDDATRVAVIESHVRVCPARHPDACLTLAPGQQARMTRDAVTALPDAAPTTAGAWSEGWLPVEDQPLVEVLDELNRWRAKPIRFQRQALADLRVSGVFPLRQTDRAVTNLARSLPLAVDRTDPASPVISRR